MKREIAVLCLSAVALAGYVRAELPDTLRRIQDSGVLNVGYREQSLPFSYLAQDDGASGETRPVGFTIDLCDRVIETLALELERPELRVEFVPVTSENRMDRMQEGAIDIECGSTTITRARRERVDFSVSFFIARVRMLVRRDSGVKDYDDLAGRRVAVTAGTTAEALLRKPSAFGALAEPDRVQVVPVVDHDEALRMVESREASAFLLDDVLLAGLAARSGDPSMFSIVGEGLSEERYGLMLPRGDPRFKALVDRTLIGLMKSGEAEKLYRRWFVDEIDPGGLKLNLPMSPELRKVFDVPTDEEFERS
ncbi:MAG TPA: amino acid ABC transporter substrate-binding protein [Burkholderiaceae bacterium]|nr:amino acid ABC transporter substrate-binding protein [Burkholderiaceae bacterium]